MNTHILATCLHRSHIAIGLLACLMLTACSGTNDGDVGFSSGQNNGDPVTVDFPIIYVKRSLPVDDQGELEGIDLRTPNVFQPGADLYFRDRASPSTDETNLTNNSMLGDVRDVSVNGDGDKVLFAMRFPFDPDADLEDQVSWNIWEFDITTETLRRVISSDISAENGQDRMPQYLPDGRIVFSSTRQRRSKAVLLDEGKPQFAALDENRNEEAFVLHVMNDDGSDIHQITFNQSHDLNPAVMDTGEIVFTRWDNKTGSNAMHLYRTRPDGTQTELLYGADSHNTGNGGSNVQFIQPRLAPDGRLLTLLLPFQPTLFGGEIAYIDVAQFVENNLATEASGAAGTGQSTATINSVFSDDTLSPGGRYANAFPLFDGTNRLLVAWQGCRVTDPNADTPDRILPCTDALLADPNVLAADPLYSAWIYDPANNTQLPVIVPEEGIMVSDIVAGENKGPLPVILDGEAGVTLDANLVNENVGVVHVRSVYELEGMATLDIAVLADPALTLASERPARFVRVSKAVSLPDDEVYDFPNTAFGRSAAEGMKEILGYAMVEPDGSFKIKVPANVAVVLDVLDATGSRLGGRRDAWLSLRAGEILECDGCTNLISALAENRRDTYNSAYDGAPVTGLPFPNTDPALFADFGETMAEVRYRLSCATDCASADLSMDLIYEDVWTDMASAGRAPDAPFSLAYANLLTPAPTSAACQLSWNANCRTVIHYEDHIHGLWALDRQILDVDGITVLADNTCVGCHTNRDDMNAPQVPQAQLDLTDGPSTDEPDHFKAYRELLFDDNQQELVMGALQDVMVQVDVDPETGDPILDVVNVNAAIATFGSRVSIRFFDRFEAGGSHAGFLTPDELRLLTEWVDNGAQYYNNPFDAPEQ